MGWCQLGECTGTTNQLSADALGFTITILDALDEAMVPLRRCSKTGEQWV